MYGSRQSLNVAQNNEQAGILWLDRAELSLSFRAFTISLTLRDGQKCLNLSLRLDDLLHRHNQSFVQRRFLLLCPKLCLNLYRTHLTQTHHKFMSGWIARNGRAGFKMMAMESPKRTWKIWDKERTGDAIVSLATYSIC
jgi:hypothetical protein